MGRRVSFIWVPGHAGIKGNSAADSAAKDALVELILFSDLKSRANKYIFDLWRSEWDEFPENKLHHIFPNLKQKRRNCDNPIAHWSFFYHSFLFTEGEEPPVCTACDERLTIEHILITCSDFIEMREALDSSVVACIVPRHFTCEDF